MAATLIIAAVVVTAIPNNFTAKLLAQQKMQKQAEEKKSLNATLTEKIGFVEGASKNMTAMNSTGTKP